MYSLFIFVLMFYSFAFLLAFLSCSFCLPFVYIRTHECFSMNLLLPRLSISSTPVLTHFLIIIRQYLPPLSISLSFSLYLSIHLSIMSIFLFFHVLFLNKHKYNLFNIASNYFHCCCLALSYVSSSKLMIKYVPAVTTPSYLR